MAKASGISVWSVQLIWRAFGLQPHRMENFKLSTDPEFFVAKVPRRCRSLCLAAEHAVGAVRGREVPIQALDRSQPMLPTAMARPHYLPPSTLLPARSSVSAMAAIAPPSSAGSSMRSKPRCRVISQFISSWTITPPQDAADPLGNWLASGRAGMCI